jgi:3-hydroxyisobutyrate dehydrogenase-like beta-hydroxyacid dehydrogenase
MGGSIAANLADRGFTVAGFDIDPGRVAALSARGVAAAGSPGDAAARSEVVLLSLPSVAAFRAVAVSPDGLLAGAAPGLVVIEASTLPLAVKEEGRAVLEQRGVHLLDCPLSGTGDQAVNRDLVVLASGDEQVVASVTDVFIGFARSYHHLGAFGNGTRMKFIANLLVAIHNVAAAEAISLAEAAGLDPRQTYEAITDGAGTSKMFEVRVPKMLTRDYSSGVQTTVFRKDLNAIAEFAQELSVPVPLFATVTQLYIAAVAAGHGADDTASVVEVLRALRVGAPAQTGNGA